MAVKFANLASSTLASSLSSTATAISVTSSSNFPALGSGDHFYASIGEGTGSEIVKVTGVSSNTFTVVRGQDGTTAQSFSAGVVIALRVVAAALDDLSAQAQAAADTESVSIAGDTMTGNLTVPSLIATNAIVDNVLAKTSSGNILFKTNGGASIARFNNNLSADFFGTISSGGITTSSHIDFTATTSLLRNQQDDSGQIGIQVKNSGGTIREVRWDAANNTNGAWRPTSNGGADLGLTNKIWNNLFVNTIKMGTGNVEVIDSARNASFADISASGSATIGSNLTVSNGELSVTRTGDNFPTFELARTGGSSKTNQQWDQQIGSTGNWNLKAVTGTIYYPIICTPIGDVNLASNSSGTNQVVSINRSLARTTFAGGIRVNHSENNGVLVTASDTNADQNFNAMKIDFNVSGSQTTSADRSHIGLFIDADSSATGGDTSDEHRLYGIYNDTRITGDSDLVYGTFSQARSDNFATGQVTHLRGVTAQSITHHNAGQVTNNVGIYGYGLNQTDGTGIVTHTYGGYLHAYAGSSSSQTDDKYSACFAFMQVSAAQTSNINEVNGLRAEVQLDNDTATDHDVTISNAYVVRATFDENDADDTYTVNNGYLFYGNYSGQTPTNAFGVYIADDVESRFLGRVRAKEFDVGGTLVIDASRNLTNIAGVSAVGFLSAAGSAGTPAYQVGDTDSGFFDSGSNEIGVSLSGVLEYEFKQAELNLDDNNLVTTGFVKTGTGTAASPALQVGDDNSGFFDSGANEVGVTLNGVLEYEFTPTQFNMASNNLVTSGTISSGSITSHDITTDGVVRSTNNANADGPNFNVSTTNKDSADYAYRVDRSGTVVGGIRLDGRVNGQTIEVGGTTVLSSGRNLQNVVNATITGTATIPLVRVTSTGDASLGGTEHGIQVGATSGQNLIIDDNEVLSRNNGAASTLHLQADGGTVTVGAGTTANFIVYGSTNSGPIVATGAGTTNTTNALTVRRGNNASAFTVRDDGVVLVQQNYLFVNNTAGMYSQGAIRARGGITNDNSNPLSISSGASHINFNSKNLESVGNVQATRYRIGTTDVIDASRNLTNIGSISATGPVTIALNASRQLKIDFDTEGDGRTSLRSVEGTANNLRPIQIEGQEIVLSTSFFNQTASEERLRISDAGVIETVSPTTGGAPVFRAGTADFLGVLIGTQGGGLAVESNNYFAIWHQPYSSRGTQANITERFHISSIGNVGINTGGNSPSARLHVVGPAARPTNLASIDTASTARFQADASNAHSLYIAENASGALIQVNDGAINSTSAKPLALQPFGGDVGIGTGVTTPEETLSVMGDFHVGLNTSVTGRGLKVSTSNDQITDDLVTFNAQAATGVLALQANGADRLVISANGNVNHYNTNHLFKSTTGLNLQAHITDTGIGVGVSPQAVGAGNTTVGLSLYSDGRIFASKSANTTMSLNRNTSDGNILELRKDGSTFGSVGVINSDNLRIGGSVADHAGLQFALHEIVPMEANVDSDGTISLGSLNSHFKNLHLSGKVYFSVDGDQYISGDAAANYLSLSAANQERLRIDSSGNIDAKTGGFQINGTTVIDSSRNLTNIGTGTFSGTITTTGGNIGLRRNHNGDGTVLRDIEFLNSFAQGSDDRAAIIRAQTQGGGTDSRGGKLVFYTRQANSSGFNSIVLDNAGVLTVGNLNSNGAIQMGGTAVIDANRNATFSTLDIESNGTIELKDENGSKRGFLQAFASAPHFRISTSNNESIGIYDGSAENIRINGSGDFNLRTGVLEINSTTVLDQSRNLQNVVNATITGTATIPFLRVTGTGDASLTSTTHGIQVGSTSGQNLLLDNNEVLSRNNGAVSTLNLQADGGTVSIGAGGPANLIVSNDVTIGSSTANARLFIRKADNDVPDHINIFCGTTQTGQIGSQDTTWLRINQNVNKNIYTPRYIRADSGFFVDNTATGLDGSGRLRAFVGSTSSVGIGFANDIDTGFYRPAANVIGVVAGGGERARIDSNGIELRAGKALKASRADNTRDIRLFCDNSFGTLETTNDSIRIKSASAIRFDCGGNDHRMNLDTSGNLVVQGNVTAFGSPSDIRLKENIERIADPVEKVKKLDGVTFQYKKTGAKSTGLIAQQLLEVLPEVVYEETDLESGESHYALRYGQVVGLLVEAMKEQQDQIDSLKSIIEEMKNGNN